MVYLTCFICIFERGNIMSSICNNCGTTIPDGSRACPGCGTMLQNSYSAPVAPVYNNNMYGMPVAPMSGLSIAGFVVSLVGLIVFGIIMGPIGLGLSIPGLVQTMKGTKRGKGFAIAGLVISIIDIVFCTIYIFFLSDMYYNFF